MRIVKRDLKKIILVGKIEGTVTPTYPPETLSTGILERRFFLITPDFKLKNSIRIKSSPFSLKRGIILPFRHPFSTEPNFCSWLLLQNRPLPKTRLLLYGLPAEFCQGHFVFSLTKFPVARKNLCGFWLKAVLLCSRF